jgi:hypothetical protein
MTSRSALYDAEGLDNLASTIVGLRRSHIHRFIREILGSHLASITVTNDEIGLREAFGKLESTMDRSAYLDLAQRLGFPSSLREACLRGCWRARMFDRPIQPKRGRRESWQQPALTQVMQRIDAILATSAHVTDWIVDLKCQEVCRDQDAAEQVAHKLARIERLASAQARDVVLAWWEWGAIGLLKHSDYPCTMELLMLQQRVPLLVDTEEDIDTLLAIQGADVIALYSVLNHPSHLRQYQAVHGYDSRLWDQSLLHQPRDAVQRQLCRERMAPFLDVLVEDLARQRGCGEDTARTLLNVVLEDGLFGLMMWRSHDRSGIAREYFDNERIRRAAEPLTGCLPNPVRKRILERLAHLHHAIVATETPLRLLPLIRDRLSSPYRRRCQRQRLPDALIADFAKRAGIREREARSWVKKFIIYGPLGIIPQREWEGVFHPRIWSYLAMFKFGRLEGTVDPALLTRCVNTYAVSLGLPALPKQIIRGVFNHFSKPGSYNSGDGPATAAVPLRKALKLAGVWRLHEQWVLIPIELDVQLVDAGMRPVGTTCHLLLVIDRGSQCPLDFWLSPAPPTRVEAGLALYQSIFHPGALPWPLRGLPEQVVVPAELTKGGIEDLTRAAKYLMAQVVIADDLKPLLASLPQVGQIIAELKDTYTPDRISRRRPGAKQQMTILQAEQRIGEWLYKRCFENHSQEPVPRRLRQHGVALPGYDTPAAGWLLPVVDEMTTKRDAVMHNRRLYVDPGCGIEPGVHARVRAFSSHAHVVRGVFVEYGPEQVLHYLPLQRMSESER